MKIEIPVVSEFPAVVLFCPLIPKGRKHRNKFIKFYFTLDGDIEIQCMISGRHFFFNFEAIYEIPFEKSLLMINYFFCKNGSFMVANVYFCTFLYLHTSLKVPILSILKFGDKLDQLFRRYFHALH